MNSRHMMLAALAAAICGSGSVLAQVQDGQANQPYSSGSTISTAPHPERSAGASPFHPVDRDYRYDIRYEDRLSERQLDSLLPDETHVNAGSFLTNPTGTELKGQSGD